MPAASQREQPQRRSPVAVLAIIWYSGLNCGPPKRYVYILISGTSDCDLIWKKGLCIKDLETKGSFWIIWVVLNQITMSLKEKGKGSFESDTK